MMVQAHIRMPQEQVQSIHDWRKRQSDNPSFTEAVRRLVSLGFIELDDKQQAERWRCDLCGAYEKDQPS